MYALVCETEPVAGECASPVWVSLVANPLTMADLQPILAALLVAFVVAALGRLIWRQ